MSAELEHEVARIRQDFGVRVHITYDRDKFFPTKWKSAPISAQGSQIRSDGAMQILQTVAAFLSMYPSEVYMNNLHNIYLLNSLTVYGLEYGGTNSRDAIYVVGRGGGNGGDEFLSATLHAEFSSILFRNYHFPKEEWSRVNDSNWKYAGKGTDLLGQGSLYDQTDDLFRRGFVRVYGQASIEEDVNMYVFSAIYRPSSFGRAASTHKKVRQKLEILIRFYEKLKSQLRAAGDFDFLTRLKSSIVSG
jgi:hypothetical protein